MDTDGIKILILIHYAQEEVFVLFFTNGGREVLLTDYLYSTQLFFLVRIGMCMCVLLATEEYKKIKMLPESVMIFDIYLFFWLSASLVS